MGTSMPTGLLAEYNRLDPGTILDWIATMT
jgi:hypothetical protein